MTPEEFKREVIRLSEIVGITPTELHIRNMKRKWASCSSRGRLTFNTDLLEESKEMRTRVIIHELLHLKYPTHGKMFNTLLETYVRNEIELFYG